MNEVLYTDLIIACEACGEVKNFTVANQSDADKLFYEYRCPNGCGRQLYSFITLGTLKVPGNTSSDTQVENVLQ